jgi:sialate O-acetylesterase
MFALKKGRKEGNQIKPMVIKAIIRTRLRKPVMAYWEIEINFKNVHGCLMARGRPGGFSLVDANGKIWDVIYSTDLKGNKVILKTALLADKSYDLYLYYGYGMSPYCNITDARDRSLPVFGHCAIRWDK